MEKQMRSQKYVRSICLRYCAVIWERGILLTVLLQVVLPPCIIIKYSFLIKEIELLSANASQLPRFQAVHDSLVNLPSARNAIMMR